MFKDLRRQLRDNRRKADEPLAVARSLFGPQGPAEVPAGVTAASALAEPLPADLQAQLDRVLDRHPPLHQSLSRLNPWQLRAVFSDEPAALVRAQVGSGKTAVLVHKVLYLHLIQDVPLREMAVLTFTHKAAGEIRTRIEALADAGLPHTPQDFWLMGTFHSVARSLLSRVLPVEHLGFRRGFSVLDQAGSEALWERLIAQHRLNVKYAAKLPQRLEALSRGERRYGAMRADDDLPQLAQLATDEKILRNVMDFDDLIAHTTALLAHPGDAFQFPRWVIVDEFQDCDGRQLELLRRLRGPETRLFAVGDPSQVIYAWRGSTPELFDQVQAEFGCTTHTLPVNYRSTASILACARSVLGLQQPGGGQPLVATRDSGSPVTIRRHHNPFLEAQYLCERIARLHQGGVPYREVAILFRTRRQGEVFRQALGDRDIPCEEPTRATLRDQPAAAWLLRLLQAAVQTGDAESVRAVLTHPAYGCLPAKAWNLKSYQGFCDKHALTGLAAAQAFLQIRLADKRTAGDPSLPGSGSRKALTETLDLCRRLELLGAWLATLPDADGLAEVLEAQLALPLRLRPASAEHPRDLGHARQWLASVERFCATDGGPVRQAFERALDQTALGGLGAIAETVDPQAESVKLLTLHAAKGLEFRHVFISGVNQGMVPLASTWGDPAADAEERRLLFVGITRAKDEVELSYHTQPAHAQALAMPSPYLLPLPVASTRWLDAPEAAPEVGPAVGAETAGQAQSAPAENAALAASPWCQGQVVRHARYGAGTITKVADGMVFCEFAKLGERSFPEKMCPLARG